MLREHGSYREALPWTDAAFLNLVEQGLVAHAEMLGGLPSVPTHLLKHLFDRGAFGLERGRLGDVSKPRRGRYRFINGRRVVEIELVGFDVLRPGRRCGADVRQGWLRRPRDFAN